MRIRNRKGDEEARSGQEGGGIIEDGKEGRSEIRIRRN